MNRKVWKRLAVGVPFLVILLVGGLVAFDWLTCRKEGNVKLLTTIPTYGSLFPAIQITDGQFVRECKNGSFSVSGGTTLSDFLEVCRFCKLKPLHYIDGFPTDYLSHAPPGFQPRGPELWHAYGLIGGELRTSGHLSFKPNTPIGTTVNLDARGTLYINIH